MFGLFLGCCNSFGIVLDRFRLILIVFFEL